MHANQRPAARQQQGVRRHASHADAPTMFNLLTRDKGSDPFSMHRQ
jgi:hypothetical protein